MTAGIISLEPIQHNGSSEWVINVDSPEIEYLREKYSHISNEEFNRTLMSATRLLSQCPSPNSERSSKTGLAIGKIQSGKTLSFTILIALAAVNRYSKIVVLGGTKNALLMQTFERLKKDLGITDPSRTSRIYISSNPTLDQLDGIRNAICSNRCALFCVLKHKTHIDNVNKLLSSVEMPGGPVLIIDDEGDEASLNNYFRHGSQSATYRSILGLRGVLPVHAYIAYTATPQANLLLNTIDVLSPSFCELIEPGDGYCGGSVFFGEQFNHYIRTIDDITGGNTIPESLRDALAIFFVGAAIRHIRSLGEKHSMLIHMTHIREEHERMTNAIRDLIRTWIERYKLRQNDPSRQELIGHFKLAYEDISRTVYNPPLWDAIEGRLLYELQSYESHMVNSLPEGVQIAETTFQLENNIVIGGNILGRGVTIKNLTVSYMARIARQVTNVDTMEQRARWFGYKIDYLDLCRIYLPGNIFTAFQGILEHEDDFWNSLQRNIKQGIPIQDWVRFFRLDAALNLRPTRASVASYRAFRPQGWETQRSPITDKKIVGDNIGFIDEFFKKHTAKTEKIGSTAHTFIRDCAVDDVVKNLLLKLNAYKTDLDLDYYIEYLLRLSIEDVLTRMDVVLMSQGEWRERSLLADGLWDNIPMLRHITLNFNAFKIFEI